MVEGRSSEDQPQPLVAEPWDLLPDRGQNHYHLLLHDERGLLSRAMRHIDGVFTQFFNRRRDRDGSLMRGRYRSRLVEGERYLLEVVRYIHANPIEARLVERAADYAWSSHRWYLEKTAPKWLRRDDVLKRMGSGARGKAALDAFVQEWASEEVRSAVASKRWGSWWVRRNSSRCGRSVSGARRSTGSGSMQRRGGRRR
jgi:hypothetical protein